MVLLGNGFIEQFLLSSFRFLHVRMCASIMKTKKGKSPENITLLLEKTSLLTVCTTVILGDPGAVGRVDKMSVVKVYCKIETTP